MIDEVVKSIAKLLQNEDPIMIGRGTTHTVYQVGSYACKFRTQGVSNDDLFLFQTEKECCDLLIEHNISCVKVFGVADGNALGHEVFYGKNVLIEEYISGEVMFDNKELFEEDFVILYDIINDINKIEKQYFGGYPSSKELSWANFLSELQMQVNDYIKENMNDVLNEYQLLDLNVVYQGSPHALMLEFNPHNYIWCGDSYKAIDVNSLLFGDPLYQWARIKMHMELHGRRHFCDKYIKQAEELTILKYMVLSCGSDLITRRRIGLNCDAHERKLRNLIYLMGATKSEKQI